MRRFPVRETEHSGVRSDVEASKAPAGMTRDACLVLRRSPGNAPAPPNAPAARSSGRSMIRLAGSLVARRPTAGARPRSMIRVAGSRRARPRMESNHDLRRARAKPWANGPLAASRHDYGPKISAVRFRLPSARVARITLEGEPARCPLKPACLMRVATLRVEADRPGLLPLRSALFPVRPPLLPVR